MASECMSFKELNSSSNSVKVRARVSRCWEPKYPGSNRIICLNMLLIDDMGEEIMATVWRKEMVKYKKVLKLGGVYEIENFNVEKTTGSHRVVAKDFTIVFNNNTSVIEVGGNHDHILMNKFGFVEFKDLSGRLHKDLFLSDVVGRLTEMSKISDFTRKDDVKSSKRDLIIVNERGDKVRVTLWGEKATSIDGNVMEDNNIIVLVITSTTVREFGGYQIHLQDYNCYSS